MESQDFENLLSDLYAVYNPSKSSDVALLVKKYNGQEFDAVKTFYFRYNFKSNPKYDPKAGSDKHVKYLIEKYSNKERILLKDGQHIDINIEVEATKENVEEINKAIQAEAEKSISKAEEFLTSKYKDVDEYFSKKESDLQKKYSELDEKINKAISGLNVATNNIKASDEKVKLKLNLNFDDVDIKLPSDVAKMQAGSRMIVFDSNGKICALEIKDVFYDYISNEDECVKEVTIERL